jgi:hypothetical protein
MLLTIAATGFESGKVAYYACAGALAIWAVVLSAIGLTRPSFPGGDRGARLVMVLSFVLMAAVMATAVATA